MLFHLQKTVAYLLMPLGFFWLVLVGLTLLAFIKKQKAIGWLLALTALGVGVAGNQQLGEWAIGTLESHVAPIHFQSLPPLQAVFVLGGGSELDPAGQPQCHLAGDRIVLAARLWHAGKAKQLVASGAATNVAVGMRNLGAETRSLWVALGVPSSAIVVVDTPCLNTREEIAAYRQLAQRHQWQNMGIISSASHLARALEQAKAQNLRLTPLGADWHGRVRPWQLQDTVPKAQGLYLWERAWWEILGKWMGH